MRVRCARALTRARTLSTVFCCTPAVRQSKRGEACDQGAALQAAYPGQPCKMVLVVRKDLKMKPGKVRILRRALYCTARVAVIFLLCSRPSPRTLASHTYTHVHTCTRAHVHTCTRTRACPRATKLPARRGMARTYARVRHAHATH